MPPRRLLRLPCSAPALVDRLAVSVERLVLALRRRYVGLSRPGQCAERAERAERRQVEAALRASEERYRELVENANDIIYTHDLAGTFTAVNHAGERLTGYPRDELLRMTIAEVVAPEHLELARQMIARKVADGSRTAYELTIITQDGRRLPVEVSTRLIYHEGQPVAVQGIARDVSARKALEAELTRQAFADALTGLPNRALFLDRLGHVLARHDRQPRDLTVLFLDLDGFKVVNDSLGHGAGDELLVAVGHRLTACLRPTDTLARFGGDEFVLLLEDPSAVVDALAVADRLLAALQAPFALSGREVVIGASIGISSRSAVVTGTTADELLREADLALYAAKVAGKRRAVVFDASMDRRGLWRLELAAALRRAIDHEELEVHYQPEMDLVSGRLVGMEALVRWRHPERGLVLPADFIPLAEETGLIVPLGQWVLEQACWQAAAWRDAAGAHGAPVMSVNLAARQFDQPDLVERVAAVLTATGLTPAGLRLEMTESMVMADVEAARSTCRSLQALGVRLAFDDFGTGAASLGYLRRLPIDTLKLDRSFITDLEHDREAVAVVQAVVALASGLGMDVIVEGIETQEQLASAITLGCHQGQGYYFSRPLPAEAAAAVLRAA